MKTTLIMLSSMTQAQKARNYLGKMKISAEVEKITSRNGCGYGISTSESPDRICRLLSAINIECKGIRESGKGGGRR